MCDFYFPYHYPYQPYVEHYPTWTVAPVTKGWECPKCGSVWAPSVTYCDNCKKVKAPNE